MNGPHDVGGRPGFGLVKPEADEPVFHADWEKRALGLTLCAGAHRRWTLDESRRARESLPPDVYYAASYYEIWVRGLEDLLVRHRLLTADELSAGVAVPRSANPALLAADVPPMLARGGRTDREIGAAPRFALGDRVRTRSQPQDHHTRLPHYAAERSGVIEAMHGAHVFPDANAHGQGEAPQHLYTVRFAAPDLFGPDADPAVSVSIDAWESYLESA